MLDLWHKFYEKTLVGMSGLVDFYLYKIKNLGNNFRLVKLFYLQSCIVEKLTFRRFAETFFQLWHGSISANSMIVENWVYDLVAYQGF